MRPRPKSRRPRSRRVYSIALHVDVKQIGMLYIEIINDEYIDDDDDFFTKSIQNNQI